MKSISTYFDSALKLDFAQETLRLRAELGRIPFENHNMKYGVGGETVRALRNLSNRPIDIYRTWAESICSELRVKSLMHHTGSKKAFDAWHLSLANDLQTRWYTLEGKYLSLAYQYKLIDLFVKWLSSHKFSERKITVGFETHAHCALDRQTLVKLNECLSYVLPIPSPSMGHVLTENTYEFCQELIAEFSLACGSTPLMFDYYAWKRGG